MIQEASAEALRGGARPTDVLATIREAAIDVPVAVMTYVNPVVRHGIGSLPGRRGGGGGGRRDRPRPARRRVRRARGGGGGARRRRRAPGRAGHHPRAAGRDRAPVTRVRVLRGDLRRDRRPRPTSTGRPRPWSRPSAPRPTSRCWSGWGSERPRRRPRSAASRTGSWSAAPSWRASSRGDPDGAVDLASSFREPIPRPRRRGRRPDGRISRVRRHV